MLVRTQFPLAFDPSLPPEPPAVGRRTGWLNSSNLRPCAVLAKHASTIRQEWAAYIARSATRSRNTDGINDNWPQLSAQHADSHLAADSRWEMLYLRRGNGSGGFLPPVCGHGDTAGSSYDVPFKKTCALLSKLEEVSWALQPLVLRSTLYLFRNCVLSHVAFSHHDTRYYPCGAANESGTSTIVGASSSLCVPPKTPSFFDSPGPVAFLRLKSGGSVPPHVGTTNLRMKCHLALEVPQTSGSTVELQPPLERSGRHATRSRPSGLIKHQPINDGSAQQHGAWVEVGGSESFSALEDGRQSVHPRQQLEHTRRIGTSVVTWHAAGQVEAFDDSFIHAVGNNAYWYVQADTPGTAGANMNDGNPSTASGSRTVLEVSFWHPLLLKEGWLLPSSSLARLELIRGRGRNGGAEAREIDVGLDVGAPLSRGYDGRNIQIEVDYNGVWNRGTIVKAREPSRDTSGASDEERSTKLLGFVKYDRSQADQQCTDEWLLLDCGSMRWSQPGFGGGGFRIRSRPA